MKRCDLGPESPSGLHCMNRYGYLNHLVCWSSNRPCIVSTTNTNSGLPLLGPYRTSGVISL